MTTPTSKLKENLRNALLELSAQEQGKVLTYGQMACIVNQDPDRFRQIFKKVSISGSSITGFRDDPFVEEKKAQAAPPAPNFGQANDRARGLKSVPAEICFVWLEQLPKQGLFVISKNGVVHHAVGHSCDAEPRPKKLADDSLVYVLIKKSGSISEVDKNQSYKYGALDSYQTPQEIEAQQKKDEAEALQRQRWEAYDAGIGIWRDLSTTALWYGRAPIAYLGAHVRIAGDGRVFAGDAPADKLYSGRLGYDNELRILLADVYGRVAPDNAFRVVDIQEPFHRRDHATYSHETTPIADFAYYADVLYERFRTSGGVDGFTERALYFRLADWGASRRRHMTVLPLQGGNLQASVLGAIRAALEADESPGARLSVVLQRNWHVTIERNSQSGENINAYLDGTLVPQDQARGWDYYRSIGSLTCGEIIGTDRDLLTEDSLNTRMRW